MKILIKLLPAILLNTTIWVMFYYYIKSIKSNIYDKNQINKLRIGLGIFIFSIAGGAIFQEPLIGFLLGDNIYKTPQQYLFYYQAYYLFWGLISASGLFIFMSVSFSKAISKN